MRHLRSAPYHKPFNILTDSVFTAANNAYLGILKKIKDDTPVLQPNGFIPQNDLTMISPLELSLEDPVTLQHTVFVE